jgi:tetratricopeptide (TPR) repeat protein
MEPENPFLWLNLGVAQQHTGDYEEAISSFQRALSIDDTLDDAWLSLGLMFYEMEEFFLCEDCYNSALLHNKKNPKAWNNMGVLHFTRENYIDARTCFENAVSYAPHYYDALFNLRDTCRQLGDFRAAAEFERALSCLSSGQREVQ